jgi:DNA-binding transcriptional regulator YdaS (Cro superfamily)
MNLNDYFVRHGQKSELARAIGVPAILVSQWSLGQRPVPIARCKAIESATDGAVTCKDLRPDDWHEIWPELKIHEASLIDTRLRREGLRGIAGGAAGSMRDSQGAAGSASLNQPYVAPKGVA